MLKPDLLSPSIRTSCNLSPRGHKYTEALLRLEGECPPSDSAKLLESLAVVAFPLITQEWAKWLAVFPDARLADFLL